MEPVVQRHQVHPSHGRVDLRLEKQDDQICLSVQDTGIGFDPEVAKRLFERFRQGDSSSTREYSGLGLGLGIVRHLAELHGGTVQASSSGENQGSTFTVRLPIRAVQAPIADAPVAAAAPTLRGISVLVVDDDPQSLAFASLRARTASARSSSRRRRRVKRGSGSRATPPT